MHRFTKKMLCLVLSGTLLLSLAGCGQQTTNNTGNTTESTTQSESTPQESQSQEATPTEAPTPEVIVPEGYVFTPTDSALVPMDYDVKIAENRNEDGSKKYVSSDVTPTICYDNLSLGYLTEDSTTYTLELAAGSTIDNVTLSAITEDYASISVDSLATWDSTTNTLTANPAATQNGTVFLDLMSGNEVLYTVNVRVVSAYPTEPGYDITPELWKMMSWNLSGIGTPRGKWTKTATYTTLL